MNSVVWPPDLKKEAILAEFLHSLPERYAAIAH